MASRISAVCQADSSSRWGNDHERAESIDCVRERVSLPGESTTKPGCDSNRPVCGVRGVVCAEAYCGGGEETVLLRGRRPLPLWNAPEDDDASPPLSSTHWPEPSSSSSSFISLITTISLPSARLPSSMSCASRSPIQSMWSDVSASGSVSSSISARGEPPKSNAAGIGPRLGCGGEKLIVCAWADTVRFWTLRCLGAVRLPATCRCRRWRGVGDVDSGYSHESGSGTGTYCVLSISASAVGADGGTHSPGSYGGGSSDCLPLPFHLVSYLGEYKK